jgi:hypothetical protein
MSKFWYSINIKSQDDESDIFNGYFSVNSITNLVTEFYEKINNNTDFTNNILIPTGTGYFYNLYLNFSTYIANTTIRYNNAYINGWKQFDSFGVYITSMSYFPQDNIFKLFSRNVNQTISNLGSIRYKDNQTLFVLYNVLPTITPNKYFIIINKESDNSVIFTGFFIVNSTTNLVIEFYETINNITNYDNNILAPIDTGFLYRSDLAFNVYEDRYPIYDNAYLSNWKNFDTYGVYIKSMSYFPISNKIKIFSNNEGDETINNIGTLVNFKQNESKNVLINISLISDPSCFNEGTKILCLNKNFKEEYISVENLRKGDLVKTYKHGYKKIILIGKNKMINDSSNQINCMYKMVKTTNNGLIDDLIVTGGHSILVNNLGKYKEENRKLLHKEIMIDDKYLLLASVSKEFIKIENLNEYTYYHFTLENNGNNEKRYGVCANGVLTETPSWNQFNYYLNNGKYILIE